MSIKVLGEALAAVAASAAVATSDAPFVERSNIVEGVINVSANFNGTVLIETSEDAAFTAPTTVATVTGTNQANKVAAITTAKYARANVTAYTAGEANVYLRA